MVPRLEEKLIESVESLKLKIHTRNGASALNVLVGPPSDKLENRSPFRIYLITFILKP